jgi:hypothetical protein
VLKSLLNYLKKEYFPGNFIRFSVCNKTERIPIWCTKSHSIKPTKKRKFVSEMAKDIEVGREAVGRAANSTWWNWDAGSTLYFWRWPTWTKRSV